MECIQRHVTVGMGVKHAVTTSEMAKIRSIETPALFPVMRHISIIYKWNSRG